MSLYHTYRPTKFSEVVGNKETITALQNMVKMKDPPSVFLFHGPTGCGKTTLARILLRELGCKGQDLHEVDSASHSRGIDSVRDIIDRARYLPLEGSIRGWIMDEFHQTTSAAQHAFLKILEDPPSHAKFVLATTNPNKIISTVKGRCSQFEVELLDTSPMVRLLYRVAKEEGADISRKILGQITDSSGGHVRDALQILEQVLSVDEDQREEAAQQIAQREAEVVELCRALLDRQVWKKVSSILGELKGHKEPESIRRAVLGYCSAVLLKGPNATAAVILDEFAENFYDTGFPGLVLACYRTATHENKDDVPF